MRVKRSFTKEFKKRVVEEVLSGVSSAAVVSRKYNIAYPLVKRWERDYAMGRLDNEPTCDAGYQEKVEQLERMVGRLTMENEVLKKALKQAILKEQQNGKSSALIYPCSEASEGGAK